MQQGAASEEDIRLTQRLKAISHALRLTKYCSIGCGILEENQENSLMDSQ